MVLTNKFKEERTKQSDHMFSGFSFKKKHEKVDWRKIAALDIEKVTKELDFDTLQDNIDHITFCNIESETQSQNYLAQVITDTEILLKDSQLELDKLKKNYDKVQKDLFDLKKENKKRKKLIEEQQTMININQANYHKCAYCSKAFLNLIYLQSHINRRHTQMNIQQIKDPEVEKELEKIKEKLRQTENELYLTKQSMTNINNIKDDDFFKKMEAWKTDQIKKHNQDFEHVKENFLRETNELKSKLTASENIINELRIRLGTQSNVGWIKDDVDLEKDTVMKQKYELDDLKIKLHSNDENYTKQLEELNKLDRRNKKQLNKFKKDLIEKDFLIEKLNTKISKLSAGAYIKKEQGTEHIKADLDENDNARNHPPPPITPRTTGRSPSPTKSSLAEHREQHHNRLSTIYMCLPEYCPKTKETLQQDESYLEFYKEEIRRRFIEQLDEIGIRIDDKKLSQNDFKSKNKDILIYRNSVATEFKHFNHMRKVFSDASDQITKKRLESSLRSSSGTNRVKFEDNLIKRPKNDSKTLNSIKRPDISASKLLDSYNRQNIKNDSETTNDEVSIPNALESNDDDTEPTKQNFNVSQHNKNKNIIKLSENYGKQSDNYEDEASELESITQIQESENEKHKKIGYVKGVAKTIDKELEQISKKGTKPGINAVPIGFHESKQVNQESNDSISSLELTENSKNQKNTKVRNQLSLDTSTNTSVWASVSHGVNNGNFNQNNNHLQHNQNISSRNEIERPATANSALTSNFDSDEFDYMP